MTNGLRKDIMINTRNTTIMKKKVLLLAGLFSLALGGKTIAQADNKCYELGSLFIEPAKAKKL
jgi:hypothetical protein